MKKVKAGDKLKLLTGYYAPFDKGDIVTVTKIHRSVESHVAVEIPESWKEHPKIHIPFWVALKYAKVLPRYTQERMI